MAAVTALLLGACKSEPSPPPAADLAVEYYAGDWWDGGQIGTGADDEPGRTRAVELRLFWVDPFPDSSLDPLTVRTRLVSTRRDHRLVVSSLLLGGARFGTGDAAAELIQALRAGALGDTVELASRLAVLSEGVSTEFVVSSDVPFDDPTRGPVSREVGLSLAFPRGAAIGDAPTLSVIVRYLDLDRSDDPAAGFDQRQISLMEADLSMETAQAALAVLSSQPDGGSGGYVLTLELSPPATSGPDAERFRDALAECAAYLTAAGEARSGDREANAERPSRSRVRSSAIAALASEEDRRRTLLLLASASAAPMTVDLAVVLDEESLAELVRGLTDRSSAALDGDDAAFSWSLEKASIAFAAAVVKRGDVSPALDGTLIEQVGQVARFPSLLLAVADASEDGVGFQGRLARQNRRFLDDADPAARVRAYEWLEVRGLAPDGYHPLDDKRARRAALQGAAEVEGGR